MKLPLDLFRALKPEGYYASELLKKYYPNSFEHQGQTFYFEEFQAITDKKIWGHLGHLYGQTLMLTTGFAVYRMQNLDALGLRGQKLKDRLDDITHLENSLQLSQVDLTDKTNLIKQLLSVHEILLKKLDQNFIQQAKLRAQYVSLSTRTQPNNKEDVARQFMALEKEWDEFRLEALELRVRLSDITVKMGQVFIIPSQGSSSSPIK